MSRFDAIFAALEGAGVRYIVVGGVAVNLHGYQRFTKDVDIVVDLLPEQALKALEALQAIGYSPRLPVKLIDFANPVPAQNRIDRPFDTHETTSSSASRSRRYRHVGET